MRKSKKTQQCNIRVSPEFLEQLQDCADSEDLTVSEYVRIKMTGVVARNRNARAQNQHLSVLQR